MTRWRRIASLASAEWKLLATAYAVVATIRVVLWALPARAVIASTRAIGGLSPRAVEPTVDLRVIVWAVEASAARVPRATCLTQALAATLLLRWLGHDCQLRIGATRDHAGVFRAHAWLERSGIIILGGERSRSFTAFRDFAERLAVGASEAGR